MRTWIPTAMSALADKGWNIVAREPGKLVLPETIRARYPRIPDEYLEFLTLVSQCVNKDSTAWFLCEDDYSGTSDSAFAWNEFELMCREALQGKEAWLQTVDRFWSAHLPILTSVKNGYYSYFAIDVAGKDFGRVVYGIEPEFEEAEDFCASFHDLMEMIVRGSDDLDLVL